MSEQPRPCEPVDVVLALQRLHRRGRLRQSHLRVLLKFGRLFLPPSRPADVDLWNDALDALSQELELRGIVQRR